ncbi:MAG: dipicolinate synthase subunit DpsA [Firmicutes bacterium]|nr:dipicolinate synthase subunit DpsA [Bacillota bacterium]
MDVILLGLNILIIGGDRREVELYFHLKGIGANVYLYGFENYPFLEGVTLTDNLVESIKISQVIVIPLTGIEENGEVYAPFSANKIFFNEKKVLNAINPQTLVIAGYICPTLKVMLLQNNVRVCETRDMDEVSIPNAIPTAEGAIQEAMANTDFTIYNSSSFVLGFGRCGAILAKTLKAMAADVTVAVRRKEVLAWIEAFGMNPLPLSRLKEEIYKADIIFNTIPVIVLNAEVLYRANKSTLIIDIATHPGGVDFAVAERLKIKAISLPGLPGKVAPSTAAQILCKVYPDLIVSYLKRGEKY